MQRCVQKVVVITLFVALSACGTSPKSEADHYNDLRDGTLYKAYQKASIEAMKPVIKEYNKQLAKDNKPQVGGIHVHALLALIWMAALEPKYSLAETEYVIDIASDPHDRYAALILQSVAMHAQGWPYLAKENSVQARALVQQHGLSNRYNNMLALVYVAGSALALQDGNFPYEANEIRELGAVTQQGWLTELGNATDDVYAGAHDKALKKLARIKNDPALSEQQRKGIDKVMQAVSAGGKDVVSNTAAAVVKVAFYVGVQDNPLTEQVLQSLPAKYRNKLNNLMKS